MAPTGALVREADVEDAATIGDVHVATWRAAYRGILRQESLDTMSDVRHAAMWADILDNSDRRGVTMVAEVAEDGVVGFADCVVERGQNNQTRAEITALYVLPRWQRQGIGRQLVAAGARALIGAGATSLVIWALEKNPARRFYAKIGGASAGKREITVFGERVTEVGYRWDDARTLLD